MLHGIIITGIVAVLVVIAVVRGDGDTTGGI